MEQQMDFEIVSDLEKQIIEEINKIGGHLLDTEIIALLRLAESLPDNSRILEIGSYRGKSANVFGKSIKGTNTILYCLDIWKDYSTQPTGPLQSDELGHQIAQSDISVLNDFIKNTDWFSENIRVLKGSSQEFSEILPENFFDLIFIDAAHDYENVCKDATIAIKSLKPGGILCGHDYHSGGTEVKKAVDEFIFEHPDVKSSAILPKTSIWLALFN